MNIERVAKIAATHGFHHDGDPSGTYWDLHEAAAQLSAEESNLTTIAGSERALCHRLAVHLERILLKQTTDPDGRWDVDCEYNRDGDNTKQIPDSSKNSKDNVLPDLIVHRRAASGSAANSLVIEMKVLRNSREDDVDRDFEKLNCYLRHFEYQRAAFVVVRPDQFASEAGSPLVVFVPNE